MHLLHGPSRSVTQSAASVSVVIALVLVALFTPLGPTVPPLQVRSLSAAATSDVSRSGITSGSDPVVSALGRDRGNLGASAEEPVTSAPAPAALPHPFMISKGPPAAYSGHYYAGVSYTGDTNYAMNDVNVTLQVPDDLPESGATVYYVLLSVWDDADSYDQIGLSNVGNGQWWILYSTTSPVTASDGCSATYYFDPTAHALTPGTSYIFNMSVAAGTVTFLVTTANTNAYVWSISAYTGGNSFAVDGMFSCGSSSLYGWTDYEEVYSTTGPVVPYDLFFTNNQMYPFGPFIAGSVTTWGTFGNSDPSGLNVYINGGSNSNSCSVDNCPITIANEPYYLYFAHGEVTTTVEPTLSPKLFDWTVGVIDLSPDSPISLDVYSAPSSWTVNPPTSEGTPPFSSGFSFSFPATTLSGSYYIGIVAFDGSGSYTRVALHVNVLPELVTSFSSSRVSQGLDVGQTVTFGVAATGGSGKFDYIWSGLPIGCLAADVSSFACTPTHPDTYSISVRTTDSDGYTSTPGSSSYVIDSDPSPSIPSATPGSGAIDAGQRVTFLTAVTGGSGGYIDTWAGLPTGCASSVATSDSCDPSYGGSYLVTFSVTDSNGFTATSSALSYVVYPLPAVTLSLTPTSVLQSGSVTIEATSSGGVGAMTYTWGGLPSGCTAPTNVTLTCSPTTPGTYEVTVTVTDQNGGYGFSSANLTVNAAFLGLPAIEGYGIVALVAAMITVFGILILARRRRRGSDRELPSIAERVREYTPRSGPSQVGPTVVPVSEVWSEYAPPKQTTGWEYGVDPAATGSEQPRAPGVSTEPLVNPPEPICWHCKFENGPASRYCAKCGLPLEPPPSSN